MRNRELPSDINTQFTITPMGITIQHSHQSKNITEYWLNNETEKATVEVISDKTPFIRSNAVGAVKKKCTVENQDTCILSRLWSLSCVL